MPYASMANTSLTEPISPGPGYHIFPDRNGNFRLHLSHFGEVPAAEEPGSSKKSLQYHKKLVRNGDGRPTQCHRARTGIQQDTR